MTPWRLAGKSLMTSSKVAWAWPPLRRSINCCLRGACSSVVAWLGLPPVLVALIADSPCGVFLDWMQIRRKSYIGSRSDYANKREGGEVPLPFLHLRRILVGRFPCKTRLPMDNRIFRNSILKTLDREVVARLCLHPVVFEVEHELEFPVQPIDHLNFVEEGLVSIPTTFLHGSP